MVAKAVALRLKHGDVVEFGDNKITTRQTRIRQGVVLRVTAKGGVLVRPIGLREEWVPYHHINYVVRKAEANV